MDLKNVARLLIELETALHQVQIRQDSEKLHELLHDEFVEIGRSGNLYNKQQVIESLTEQRDRPAIHAENFKMSLIDEGVALLTYESFYRDGAGIIARKTLRASIWKQDLNNDRWQMRFHQGTAAAGDE